MVYNFLIYCWIKFVSILLNRLYSLICIFIVIFLSGFGNRVILMG